MDRMRESVFAALGDISARSFLDLFAGSGIVALEAASRGASPVEAVEADGLKRGTLLKNAAIAPVRINCRFMAAELYIRRAKRSFDYIFCDPPFPYRFRHELAVSIAVSALMNEDSLLMTHRPREDVPRGGGCLVLADRREYGRSVVDFWHIEERAVKQKDALG
jgi:16S rRNA (guanine(966)-N(2))-methyltransferase RsmD